MAKKNLNDPELVNEEVKESIVEEEPKKIQNEGKKLFSSVKEEGGTRAY
jgi:hypothetical protein